MSLSITATKTRPISAAMDSLTSAVWREPLDKIIRRKLIPSLEHVTWRDPTITPSRLAISSRLSPSATSSLIFSIGCEVNLARLPLADELAFVIVMISPSLPVWPLMLPGCFTRGCFLVVQTMGEKNSVNNRCRIAKHFRPKRNRSCAYFIGLLRIACLVILYKTCRDPDEELAADGISGPGMRPTSIRRPPVACTRFKGAGACGGLGFNEQIFGAR